MKLSKDLIKKYGISKKAWAIQRGRSGKRSSSTKKRSRSKSRSYKTTKRKVNYMAKKKSYRKTKSLFGALQNPIMGAVGVVGYESLISPMIPVQGVAKDIIELMVGAWASKKRGILGATGKSLVVLNSYQLVQGIVGNKLQGLMGGNSSSTYEYNY